MSGSLPETLNQWAEISVQRSMYEFGHFLRARGISMPQIMLLMHLRHSERCAVSDIGRHLDISNPAASQLIQRLVEQGLVQREEGQADRRVKEIFLTDQGRQLIQAAIDSRSNWIVALAEQLPINQQKDVEIALKRLISAADTSLSFNLSKEDRS